MNTLRLSDYKDKLIHFIGIGGSSMSGLAELLTALGYQVRGDDRSQSHSTDKLIREGIPVVIGHDAKNVHGAGLVVYTAAIAPDNVERMECERLGIPQMERAELLGQISEHYPRSVAICGTHGKTTSTSMLSTVLLDAGRDPSIHIGGEIDLIGGSVHAGSGDTFITEACEFKASFLTLHPTLALVLNIDEDHLDFYKDIHEIEDTFAKFLGQIVPGGMAVLCGDDVRALSMKQRISVRSVTYGLDNPDCDYTAKDITHDDAMCFSFTPVEHGVELPRVTLRVPGRHNALNALGVTAAARELGLTGADVVLVGDMLTDAHLAEALGADCVLVSWGHNDLKRLESAGLPVVHSVEALENILAKY